MLADTPAGLRDSADAIEQEGTRRAVQRAEGAEIRLFVFDTAHPEDAAGASARPGADTILVASKIDLAPAADADLSPPALPVSALPVSALTGEGIDGLLRVLGERVAQTYRIEAPVLTRARHRQALEGSRGIVAAIVLRRVARSCGRKTCVLRCAASAASPAPSMSKTCST